MIHYTTFDSPLGRIFIAKSNNGICRIGLPSDEKSALLDWLHNQFPGEELIEDPDKLFEAVSELKSYFAGQLKEFTFPLDLRTTPFRKRALGKVREIPYGKTASYKEIAERMENSGAVRAVGGANANNPIPIVIPCHRVIAHNGSLGGYGGRLDWKAWLLELERAP